jgi:transcriptional antiterminator RfaH
LLDLTQTTYKSQPRQIWTFVLDLGMAQRWAVIVARFVYQEKIIKQLKAEGFECFFPRIKRTVRHRGKRIHRLEPLLHNYVPFRLEGSWQTVFGMRGVLDVLGPTGGEQIALLRAQCDKDDIMREPEQSSFVKGCKVRVTSGPLQNFIGSFVGMTSDQREVAAIEILGAKRSIRFEAGNLVAA